MTTTTEFTSLAGSIARELGNLRGETWTVGPGWDRTQRRLHGPHEAVVFVSTDEERIFAHGSYPRTNAQVGHEDITVAASRGGPVIAKEINRRLLPVYLAKLAEVLKYNKQEQAEYEARGRVLNQAAGLFGESYEQQPYEPGQSGTYSDSLSMYHFPGAQYGSVKATGSPDTLTLELHAVPREIALRMLAVLAETASREGQS